MHLALNAVLEFHKKMGQTIGDPRKPNIEQEQAFRLELIREELKELEEALAAGDTVETADALADLAYVLTGAAVTWGIDIASVFDEVHRSNMTKKLENKRADGKVLKDKDFSPPRVAEVLKECAQEFDEEWWEKPTVFSPDNKSPQPIKCERNRCGNSTTTGLCAECASGPYFDPPERVSQNIMMAAKDQAKILAMRDITTDFLPGIKSNGVTKGGIPYTINENADWKAVVDENYPLRDNLTWEVSDGVPKAIKGEFTTYGAYVFDCPCGRTHAVQARLGSRGGLAKEGKAECMCGNAFKVDFSQKDARVTLTTIEDLRKAQ